MPDALDLSAAELGRLRRAADRDEIRQLAYRYAWTLDVRDREGMADLFVPEAKEASLRRFDRFMAAVGVTVLLVGNHLVDFDGPDRAHGIVYCLNHVDPRIPEDPGRFIEQAIVYRDRYRRCDGAWKFVDRTHELFYGVVTAERPLSQRAAEWPRHHDGVGTVPYDEPTWKAFWERVEGEGA